MRFVILFLLLTALYSSTMAQTKADKYNDAYALLNANRHEEAIIIFDSLLAITPKDDSLFNYIIYYNGVSNATLSFKYTKQRKWKEAIYYSNQYINLYNTNKEFYDENHDGRIYWVYKNMVVASRGIGNAVAFEKYRKIMYTKQKEGLLPNPLDENFCFEHFTWNGLNVWGYEWYPELGDDATKGSFSKQIFYVYSTTESGDDDKMLFTLQTVKIHKFDNSIKDDYVLTYRKYNDAGGEISKTIWTSTFSNPIDYDKLHTAVVNYLDTTIKPNLDTILKGE